MGLGLGQWEQSGGVPVLSEVEKLRQVRGVRCPSEAFAFDVRPEDEFALGHLPGAHNIPLSALKRHLAKLDRKTEIIAYCRGPYCILSFEAVAQLRKLGFKARRLEDGLPEWKAAGLPVQTSSPMSEV